MTVVTDTITVNWNSGRYLADCIASVRAYGGDALAKVIVVDNSSTDGSLALDESWPSLDVVRAGENLGFAKACNLGAKRGDAPYILFLNPDARLMEGTLEKALAFMESAAAARVGICGVRLIDTNGYTARRCARFPRPRIFVGRALGLEGVLPSLFPSHFMREFDHLSSRAVDQVIGAFFLVRRALFEKLGGFDERFFVYFEEVDFTLRARQAGWSTWYLADVVAFHAGGGTSEKVKAERLFYSIRSRMLYAIKHFSPVGAATVIAFALLVEPFARFFLAALHASPREAWNTLRSYGMIWKNLPAVLRTSRK